MHRFTWFVAGVVAAVWVSHGPLWVEMILGAILVACLINTLWCIAEYRRVRARVRRAR